uniref:Lysophospholipid acyltransferase 5 n=1 Tax=Ciona savignyi TaxID=51511 RepID=H2ZMU1_CIOSA
MVVNSLSRAIGVPEPAIKLIITVYSGYPLAFIHRLFPYKEKLSLQYAFFTLSSLGFLFWNYGFDIYHSLLCLFAQWLIFKILGASSLSVLFSFVFQLGYLIYGYIIFSTSDYDINWCMPHCILTLRMIGLAWDVYDGHQNPYPLQWLRSLQNGELTDQPGKKPNSLFAGLRRGLSGTLLLAVQAYISTIFTAQYYTTQEFQASSFVYKVGYISVTGHITLLQYVAIWIINEGSCIICGLGYKKDQKTGKITWDAVGNVKLRHFLTARSFQDIINSFNINTNGWVLRYVFKRLRFVGVRLVSHLSALYFLAIWHGIHEGYFTCFTYEWLTMTVEKPLFALLRQSTRIQNIKSSKFFFWLPPLCGWLYLHILLGYCVIDFTLLKWKVYAPVYKSVYCYGHVFFGSLFILLKIRSMFQKDEEHPKKS